MTTPLRDGDALAHYRIVSKLGEGGMGEVYRATDTKLKRQVAIKVLPAAFLEDKERLARFEREAQLLAQLQHPNIASIYGVEESAGSLALVMELVEGPTLAERLEHGPLPLHEALELARQIAEALEEAHGKGIIHRDLKPQNVKATVEGKVKVLDFGLAKAMDPAGAASGGSASQLAASPTLTLGATVQGMVLGTAAYMAPEQAKGMAVDKRADIWAFGVVLFEMLTGSRLFAGDSVPDTLAGVLRAEIDLSALPDDVPPAIRRLLRRCLERKPRERLHDIADARIVIDEVLRGVRDEPERGSVATIADEAPRRPAWQLPVALVATAALGVAAGWLLRPANPPQLPALELALALPPGYTFARDNYPEVTISASGRRQVVTVLDEGGTSHLLLRDLEQAETRILTGTEGAAGPAISPDGESVAFVHDGSLWRVATAGGPPIALAALGNDYRGATWSPDGYIYFSAGTNEPVSRVAEAGGTVEKVTTLDTARQERTHRWPSALPDGSAVLFTSDTAESSEFYDDARIEAVRPATGERKVVLEGSSQATFLAPDHLLFARGGTLFTIGFDPRRLETTGTPVPLVHEVSTEVASGAVRFAVAASGAAIWVPGEAASELRKLEWIEADGSTMQLGFPEARYSQIALAPDGRRFVAALESGTAADLWVFDAEAKAKSRLTFSGSPTDVVWSPDGKRVAYAVSTAESGIDMFWKPADGSGEPELLVHLEGDQYPETFTPDGRAVLFENNPPGIDRTQIARLDLATRQVETVLDEPTNVLVPKLSPDGRWLAYISTASTTRADVMVRRYPEITGRWQVSLEGGVEPCWSPEGDALYFRNQGALYRVPVDTRQGFVAGTPQPVADRMVRGIEIGTYAVARGGRVLRALGSRAEQRSNQINLAFDLAARARALTSKR